MATGLVSGNAVFYVVLIANRWLVRKSTITMILKEICQEFGWPEFFDWIPIRPLLIVGCCLLTNSVASGTAWGHGLADGIFYLLGFSPAGVKMAAIAAAVASRLKS